MAGTGAGVATRPNITISGRLGQSDYYKWLVMANLVIGTTTTGLSQMSIQIALPRMMSTFGVDVEKIQWVASANMIASVVTMPLVGWLGGIFGNRLYYLSSLAVFMISSALCGISSNINEIIFFRIFQGMATGAMQPIAMTILYNIFPPEQRGLALGVSALSIAFGPALGPPVGGYLVEILGWRSVFYINVPLGLISILMALLIMPKIEDRRRATVDFPGLVTMMIFLITLMVALTQGRREGWDSQYILTLFTISAISFVAFLIVELRTPQPIVDLSLFKILSFSASGVIRFLFGAGYSSVLFLLTLFLQTGLHYTPIQAGMLNLPGAIVMAITGIIAGRVSDKVDPRTLVMFGLLGLSYMNDQLSKFNIWTSASYIILMIMLRMFAMSWVNSPLNNANLRVLPEAKVRMGSGLVTLVGGIGGSFGTAVLSSYFTKKQLFYTALLSQDQTISSLGTSLAMRSIRNVLESQRTGDFPDILRAKSMAVLRGQITQEATISAYQDSFRVVSIIFLLGLIPAFFVGRTLDKKEKS
ncbi:MAG: DHA2 family efflux MFS transporter permease subunit [Candidatus Tectomicrobia bacterium]|nr:DHA2 family efflux MFS transporter permease subunit [Candidatus Tectomicrobia bacterium]